MDPGDGRAPLHERRPVMKALALLAVLSLAVAACAGNNAEQKRTIVFPHSTAGRTVVIP